MIRKNDCVKNNFFLVKLRIFPPNRESSTAFITRERDHGESHALQNKYGGHASEYCGYTTPKMYSG